MHVTNTLFPANCSIDEALQVASKAILAQQDLCYSDPKLEARLLLQEVLGLSHSGLIARANDVLSLASQNTFSDFVAARLSGQPIAFILGHQAFWTLQLKVAPCTLIPRQDTEVLVETALSLSVPAKAEVLDLGTGTGAIALALAKEKPSWSVLGLDKIDEAVELAQENAKLNNLEVNFQQSDWFQSIKTSQQIKTKQFDLIVTNPPYVESGSEYLNKGDLRFEPQSALVSGSDGLDDIRHIVTQARDFLNHQGWLMIEHGFEQSKAIQNLLLQAGYCNIESKHDYNNLPRVTFAQL